MKLMEFQLNRFVQAKCIFKAGFTCLLLFPPDVAPVVVPTIETHLTT